MHVIFSSLPFIAAATLIAPEYSMSKRKLSHSNIHAQIRICRATQRAAHPLMGGNPPPPWAPPRVWEVTDRCFSRTLAFDERNKMAALWRSLVACYRSEDLALQALQRNPFLIDPRRVYDPQTLLKSRDALRRVLDNDDAVVAVMRKNPNVLLIGDELQKKSALQIELSSSAWQAVDTARTPLMLCMCACAFLALVQHGAPYPSVLLPFLAPTP
eukprot:6176416-Pleurochrysis_carterae.AAC.2